jgi:hypothetical protein
MSDEDLVVVFRAPSEVVADIVKGLLDGEGIPVLMKSRQVPMYDGALVMGEGYWGDIAVPREHADRARAIIEAYEQSEGGN